ncbi:pentraxin-4-like [Scleropages formosus]|uniref:Pentraxin-4-like n=1 Tax=Scleropages formosus TaxID=113540 RepID=A0A0P7VAS9_SCLFO|nr:pentraxin-4-like [Scleropages formosus]
MVVPDICDGVELNAALGETINRRPTFPQKGRANGRSIGELSRGEDKKSWSGDKAGDRYQRDVERDWVTTRNRTWEKQGENALQGEQRKPFFQKLRSLEEQFRRFQEVTLSRLNAIAANYNISYNIDMRFQELTDHYHNISSVLNDFQAITGNDLNSLKFWTKRLQKKTKKLELKVESLEKSVNDNGKVIRKEGQERRGILSNLTQEIWGHASQIGLISADRQELQEGLQVLHDSIRKQENKMSQLEKQVRNLRKSGTPPSKDSSSPVSALASGHSLLSPAPQGVKVIGTAEEARETPVSMKLQQKHLKGRRTKEGLVTTRTPPTPLDARPEAAFHVEPEIQDFPQLPLKHKIPQKQHVPKKASTKYLRKDSACPESDRMVCSSFSSSVCNVKSMLLFPFASIENYVTFKKSFLSGIHELSICTWLRVDSVYMGTLLSYATEENDNKLVLYGRNSSRQESIDFVIGDPAYRELPVGAMLDGRWHHLCIIWSSIEGRFWQYVDRRLASTGSKFQKGYEIQAGGSLVLGQEQDSVGGGFDEAEAFVGRVAGFAVWDRALSPGEVSGIATGRGLPRGSVLTLDDVEQLSGSVQLVHCECLEHCT